MRSFAILTRGLVVLLLSLLAVRAGAATGDVRPTAAAMVSVDIPAGFATLAESQHVVADFRFGGRRIGQFEVEASPGRVRVIDPGAVVAAIPGLIDPAAVAAALTGTLDANARYLCDRDAEGCETPHPQVAAILFDARRFTATLVIAPGQLVVRPINADRYLAPAGRAAGLVDTVAGALAGGDGQRRLYTVRNRVIVAAGDARLVSELSYSSGQGASIDTLAAQLDRPGIRYTGGVSYAPGADLVGRRRILGVGIASQFDTRTDSDAMTGTPLVVFLGERSRVDLSTGGRLVSSHSYEAGNQALDTTGLPEGSYPVEIRIQAVSGGTRTERRFFTKGAGLPPPGRTLFFANAGMIAVDRPGTPITIGRAALLSAGAARRMGEHLAWDATVMATDRKALAELGASWFNRAFQARAAVLGSSDGDLGALLSAASAAGGRIGYSFDLRHVGTRGRRPIVPLDTYAGDAFSIDDARTQLQRFNAVGYSQFTGTLSWRIARAQLGLSAYWRHDKGQDASYAIGPTIHWPLIQSARAQLGLDGSYAQTDRGRSVAFGLRFQLFAGRASITGSGGAQTGGAGGGDRLSGIAELGASVQRSILGGQMNASAGVQRSDDGAVIQAALDQRGRAGYFTGNLVRRADGDASSTQYGLGAQTMLVATHGALAIGGREQTDAAIVVTLAGHARDTRFEVLVDDTARGVIRPGGRIAVPVLPYRRYAVRLRPLGGALVAFDAEPRTIDVFPGGVAALRWTAEPVLAMFGRLVRPDGAAVADADVTAPGGAIAATDGQGWFQLQAAGDVVLTARTGDGRTCRAQLSARAGDKGYTALGTVPCRP